MQGLPDGSEEARLQEIEAEVEQHAAALKQVKAQNRQARTQPLRVLHRPLHFVHNSGTCLTGACLIRASRTDSLEAPPAHAQAEAAAAQVLERLEAAHAQYASQRGALATQLDDLEKRVADAGAAAAAAQAARDAAVAGLGTEGLDEAALHARLAAAAADSRMQEAAIAAQEARPATADR